MTATMYHFPPIDVKLCAFGTQEMIDAKAVCDEFGM